MYGYVLQQVQLQGRDLSKVVRMWQKFGCLWNFTVVSGVRREDIKTI